MVLFGSAVQLFLPVAERQFFPNFTRTRAMDLICVNSDTRLGEEVRRITGRWVRLAGLSILRRQDTFGLGSGWLTWV